MLYCIGLCWSEAVEPKETKKPAPQRAVVGGVELELDACGLTLGGLTPEGEIYHLRARDILASIDDADAEVSQAGQRPRGRLRVNCVPAFAFHQLMPTLPEPTLNCDPSLE